MTSDVAGGLEWATWVAGAPLLITVAAAAARAALTRRLHLGPQELAAAVVGAGAASAVLVAVTQRR